MNNRSSFPIYEGDVVNECPTCKSFIFLSLETDVIDGKVKMIIKCDWCDLHTKYFTHKKEAIEAWNNKEVFLGE